MAWPGHLDTAPHVMSGLSPSLRSCPALTAVGAPAGGGGAMGMGRPPPGGPPPARGSSTGASVPGFVPQHARMPEDSRDELAAMRAAGSGAGPLTDAHLLTLEDAIRDAVRCGLGCVECGV